MKLYQYSIVISIMGTDGLVLFTALAPEHQ